MYKELRDVDLMPMVASGNHDAFTEIVRRHTQRFFSLAFRSLQHQGDAEDVVQSAFIKLWQNPQAWNSEKSQFTTWFYRVIVNACHDHRRKNKRLVDVDDQTIEAATQAVSSEQHLLESQQQVSWRQQCLEVAIDRLPASQRDALNLVVYSELPQKQAAEVMGISLKALESLLVRARRAMAKTVNEMRSEEVLPGAVHKIN